jgi:hypothetical protein
MATVALPAISETVYPVIPASLSVQERFMEVPDTGVAVRLGIRAEAGELGTIEQAVPLNA